MVSSNDTSRDLSMNINWELSLTKYIVHCSYTPPSLDIGVKEIRGWHTSVDPSDPSKPWNDIGYHFVIKRDGAIEEGRPIHIAGAHTLGHNKDSVGVCLVGGMAESDKRPECNFTYFQYLALVRNYAMLKRTHPSIKIYGHNYLNSHKACPTFDVNSFFESFDKKI